MATFFLTKTAIIRFSNQNYREKATTETMNPSKKMHRFCKSMELLTNFDNVDGKNMFIYYKEI